MWSARMRRSTKTPLLQPLVLALFMVRPTLSSLTDGSLGAETDLARLLAAISLAIFATNVHRHRVSGASCTMSAAWRLTTQNPQSDISKEGAGAQQTLQSYPMNQRSEVSRN